MFGIFLVKLVELNGGTFSTVELDDNILSNSKKIYSEIFPNLRTIDYHCMDSVKFLGSYDKYVNFVHLDSFDLDMKNPIPSMLHGWLEFEAIKDKMPSGSLVVIDDNFIRGTVVYWNNFVNGEFTHQEEINVNYDIIGKGALIYHWVLKDETDWDLIGNHYNVGENVKIVVRKR